MNAAAPFPWLAPSASANPKTTFRAVFEHAPIPVARCSSQGVIVEMNPPFEGSSDRSVASRRCLRLCKVVRPEDRDKTESLLGELPASRRDSIVIEARGSDHAQPSPNGIAWREPGSGGEPAHGLLIAERPGKTVTPEAGPQVQQQPVQQEFQEIKKESLL